ncbi:unannotated protein [freshwater metagenome]|uniref:Unannotated protein n=1 Tax=freshwater metagenome TaxID=449393 RepID=A0A6J6LE27_9ZZZZ
MMHPTFVDIGITHAGNGAPRSAVNQHSIYVLVSKCIVKHLKLYARYRGDIETYSEPGLF